MSTQSALKQVFERTERALAARPAKGRGVGTTVTTRLRDGLACEIEAGAFRLRADLPPVAGGTDTGPSPGGLGRAALGSCLAMGIVMWSAKLDVPLAAVEVRVETESDASGLYGVGDLPAGWLAVRYTVTVESEAPEADVLRAVETAEAHSPLLDSFRRPLNVTRAVTITVPAS